MEHQSLDASQRPRNWGKLINQDNNFYQISSTIFRSEQPVKDDAQALKQHNIQTIINLRPNNKTLAELNREGFDIQHVPIYTWKINRNDVLKTMQIIQKAKEKNNKVLIHCYHGSDRTGAMVAMYRILFENWTTEHAVKEMKYGGYGFHPIWKNIDQLFTEENIAWLKQQLNQSSF